jgi:AcrR family transcriptional regulator
MTVTDMARLGRRMGRWAPDSRGRLRKAAMELYAERGFEATTVAEIADRAGVTERTFFRQFADKREVLFAGSEGLADAIAAAITAAPSEASPLDAAAAGVEAAGGYFPERAYARRRRKIIDANPDLLERELIKLASLARAIAGALRDRGVDPATATLTAEVALGLFRVAFERWIAEGETRGFAELARESVAQLRALAATG